MKKKVDDLTRAELEVAIPKYIFEVGIYPDSPSYLRSFSGWWGAAKKVLEGRGQYLRILIELSCHQVPQPCATLSWDGKREIATGATEAEALYRAALKVVCGEEIEV